MMETREPVIDHMQTLAVPLDSWCEFCELRIAYARVPDPDYPDGRAACAECLEELKAAMAKVQAEMAEAYGEAYRLVTGGPGNRAQRRAAAKRAKASRRKNRAKGR